MAGTDEPSQADAGSLAALRSTNRSDERVASGGPRRLFREVDEREPEAGSGGARL